MRIIILFLLLGIVSSSCSTKLKQQVRAHNYFNKYPMELAALCGTKFPPEVKYKPGDTTYLPSDTTYLPGDTVKVTVDCPDGTKVTKDCPPAKDKIIRIPMLRVDTFENVNTALVTELNYKIATLEGKNFVLTEENKTLKQDISTKNWQLAGLITFIIIATLVRLFFYLKLRK